MNSQLDQIGYNMGSRMSDFFFAAQPSPMPFCTDFRQTMEVIAKVAFKLFLGVAADVTAWDFNGKSCSLHLRENPLSDFVILPQKLVNTLWYTNVLCGVVRGALDMLNIKVKAYFVRDILRGDEVTEIRVELVESAGKKTKEDSD